MFVLYLLCFIIIGTAIVVKTREYNDRVARLPAETEEAITPKAVKIKRYIDNLHRRQMRDRRNLQIVTIIEWCERIISGVYLFCREMVQKIPYLKRRESTITHQMMEQGACGIDFVENQERIFLRQEPLQKRASRLRQLRREPHDQWTEV